MNICAPFYSCYHFFVSFHIVEKIKINEGEEDDDDEEEVDEQWEEEKKNQIHGSYFAHRQS